MKETIQGMERNSESVVMLQTACERTNSAPAIPQIPLPPPPEATGSHVLAVDQPETDLAAQYRDLVRRRVSGLCAVPGCDGKAERDFRCLAHAPPKPVKPRRYKQAVLRLK